MLHTTAKMMFMDIGNQFNATKTGEEKIMASKQVTTEEYLSEIIRSRPSLERAYTQLKAAGATVTKHYPRWGGEGEVTFLLHRDGDVAPRSRMAGKSFPGFWLYDIQLDGFFGSELDDIPVSERGQLRWVPGGTYTGDDDEGQTWVSREYGAWVEPTAIEIAQENGIRFSWKNEDTLVASENGRRDRRCRSGVRYEDDPNWVEGLLS